MQQYTPEELTQRTLARRAVEAVIWGMPAVNAELMFQAVKNAKAELNQVVYWSRPISWKNQTLTPNPDTIYLMPFFNTKDAGPMVLEIPPADGRRRSPAASTTRGRRRWRTSDQRASTRARVASTSSCRPDYKDEVPDGYIALPSATYTGFALLRSNLKSGSDADIAKAVAYGKRVKFYPLVAGGESSQDDLRRCDRRRVRQHHSLRPALLRDARPLRAARAVARARQGDDRPAQDDRHREGQAIRPRRENARDPRRCRARSAGLARSEVRGRLLAAVQRRHALGAAGRRRGRRSDHDATSPARCLSRRRSRRHVFDGVLQRQAPRRGSVLPDDASSTRTASRSTAAGPIACTCRRTRRSTCTGRRPPTTARRTRSSARSAHGRAASSNTPGLLKNADGSVDIYFASQGTGGQGVELGADDSNGQVRSAVPPLRSREALLRQDVEAAGH